MFINQTSGERIYVSGGQRISLNNAGTSSSWKAVLPEAMAEGSYIVKPALLNCATNEWQEMQTHVNGRRSCNATVKGTQVVFNTPEETMALNASDFHLPNFFFAGRDFNIDVDLSVTGAEEYLGEVYLCVLRPNSSGGYSVVTVSNPCTVNLSQGKKTTAHLKGSFKDVAAGNYVLSMARQDNGYKGFGEKVEISVVKYVPGTVEVSELEVVSVPEGDEGQFCVKAKIQCPNGYYEGPVKMELAECDADGNILSSSTRATGITIVNQNTQTDIYNICIGGDVYEENNYYSYFSYSAYYHEEWHISCEWQIWVEGKNPEKPQPGIHYERPVLSIDNGTGWTPILIMPLILFYVIDRIVPVPDIAGNNDCRYIFYTPDGKLVPANQLSAGKPYLRKMEKANGETSSQMILIAK